MRKPATSCSWVASSTGRAGNLRPRALASHAATVFRGEPATITPDVAFERAANTAAIAYSRRPPFVSYRVMAHASAPSINRQGDVNRRVDERTADDLAILHDLPRGAVTVGHGFPLTPTFDALSYFTLTWYSAPHHSLESFVHDVTPLTYKPHENTGADVVVTALRAYRAAYADDSDPGGSGRTHITLSPYDFVRQQNNADRTFYFSDLYVDNTTGLPAIVKFDGADDKVLELDYGIVEGHWMVRRAHYEETLHGPLRLGRLHVLADAAYDDFAFPTAPPDPRLAGPVVVTPAAAPAGPAATPSPLGSLSAPAP